MARFTVIGGDGVSLSVDLGSVVEAADFARTRGVDVRRVVSESGMAYVPVGTGFEKDTGAVESQTDLGYGMIAVAALIPIVGLLAGCVRIGVGKSGGDKLIGAAILGALLWALVVAAA